MHSERVKNIELTKLIESPAVTERGTFLNHLNKKNHDKSKKIINRHQKQSSNHFLHVLLFRHVFNDCCYHHRHHY
jgi:hypothetical protein